MKWIILMASLVLMAGCTRDIVEYREVTVATPASYYSFPQPLDVTHNTIDYF